MTDDPHTDSDLILASDGGALQRLTLVSTVTENGAALVDAAGTPANPWEVELRRWPSEAERGGYLPDRSPDLELWRNRID